MKVNLELLTKTHNLIRLSLFHHSNPENLPLIILIHGFKGFKDWGYGNYFCDFLANNGFLVLSFNFSHNGIGADLENFTEPEKFATNTISLELDELDEIISWYLEGKLGFVPKNQKIGLIGHSRGGALAIIKASEDPRISAVTSWASISYFERYTPRQIKIWKEQGFLEVINSRTNQVMRLNKILLEDFMNNKERFNLLNCVKKIDKPFLIVHGELDLTVPFEEAQQIYDSSNKNISQLLMVPKANHTFDIVHPFEGTNEKFELVKNKTLEFFNTYIK